MTSTLPLLLSLHLHPLPLLSLPYPSDDAVVCPYPPPSSILPCECLTELDTFRVFLYCHWTMGQDDHSDALQFQSVMDQFDSYQDIYVMQMTCDGCWDHQLDGFFNENTTGKFHIEYLTVEHFETTSLPHSSDQFSEFGLLGSRDSLVYAKLYPFHYFSPSPYLLSGMKRLEHLELHNLDTAQTGLPNWSTLSSLRLLSLLDGNLGSVSQGMLQGLDQLDALFLDRCHISKLEPGSFSTLPNLTHLSLSHNNITKVPNGTFTDTPSLKLLNMGDSNIQEVKDSFLEFNTDIHILLHNNNIRTLPEDTWRPLVKRIVNTTGSQGWIDLDNNPLDCGCDVKWFVVKLGAPPVFVNARCANGEKLLELDPEILEFFCPDKV